MSRLRELGYAADIADLVGEYKQALPIEPGEIELPEALLGISAEYMTPQQLATAVVESNWQFKPPRWVLINMLRRIEPAVLDDENNFTEIYRAAMIGNPDVVTLYQLFGMNVSRSDAMVDDFNYILWLRLHYDSLTRVQAQEFYNFDFEKLLHQGMYESIAYLIRHGAEVDSDDFMTAMFEVLDSDPATLPPISAPLQNLIRFVVKRSGVAILNIAAPMSDLGDMKTTLFGVLVLLAPALALELVETYPGIQLNHVSEDGSIGHFGLIRIRDYGDAPVVLELLRLVAHLDSSAFQDVDMNGETAADYAGWLIEHLPAKTSLYQQALNIINIL